MTAEDGKIALHAKLIQDENRLTNQCVVLQSLKSNLFYTEPCQHTPLHPGLRLMVLIVFCL